MRFLQIAPLSVLVMLTAASANAGGVSVNGTAIPKAVSSIDESQDVTEFRAGTESSIQLVPGLKRYGVCIAAQGPIAILDAEFPLSASASRFTVQVEDGRRFVRCLAASLGGEGKGKKRRLTYCLRCEDVQPSP